MKPTEHRDKRAAFGHTALSCHWFIQGANKIIRNILFSLSQIQNITCIFHNFNFVLYNFDINITNFRKL